MAKTYQVISKDLGKGVGVDFDPNPELPNLEQFIPRVSVVEGVDEAYSALGGSLAIGASGACTLLTAASGYYALVANTDSGKFDVMLSQDGTTYKKTHTILSTTPVRINVRGAASFYINNPYATATNYYITLIQ